MRCPSPFRRLLESKVVPGKSLLVEKQCNRWACPACSNRLKRQWIAHARRNFSEAGAVFLWQGGLAEFESRARRAIKRRGGDYVRIVTRDGSVAVFATVALAGATPARRDGAGRLFAQLIQDCDKKLVSTSRGWKMPAPPERESEWSIVARVRMTIEDAKGLLEFYGLEARRSESTSGANLFWETEERFAGIFREVIVSGLRYRTGATPRGGHGGGDGASRRHKEEAQSGHGGLSGGTGRRLGEPPPWQGVA